jgi:hypothetical protein
LRSLVEEAHFKEEKWFQPGDNAITSNGRVKNRKKNCRCNFYQNGDGLSTEKNKTKMNSKAKEIRKNIFDKHKGGA